MYCVYYIHKESDRDRWKERKHAQFFFSLKKIGNQKDLEATDPDHT